MKARKFKKLRKKLTDKEWLNRKYKELLEDSSELEHFYKFECSNFFNGENLAEYNRSVYYKKLNKIETKLKYIKKRLGKDIKFN